jgi:PAS domain S-box-containing protein
MKRIEGYSGHERLVLRTALQLSANPVRRGARALHDRSCLSWLLTFLVATGRNLMRRHFAHRQLGDELRKSEARYRTVLDAAFEAIVTITPEGIVRWFNRGAERIFGHRAEEVIGQPVTLHMPERYRDLCVAGLHRYLRTGEARVVGGTTELVGLRKDGGEFPIEMSLGETRDDGEWLFTAVIRDVTECKEVENVVRES